MKKNIAQRWIKALKSGKYKQGRDRLKKIQKDNERHCCLGVLCELYNKDQKSKNKKPIRQRVVLDLSNRFSYVQFGSCSESTPPTVKKWSGLTSDDDVYFADLNDRGCSFKKIASIIEDQLQDYY